MLLLLLFTFSALVAAQDNDQGVFSTPPAAGIVHDYSANPIYNIGQQLDLQWKATSFKTISLWLWQNDNPTPELLIQNEPNSGSLSWQVKTDKNYSAQSDTNGTVFFLQITQASDASNAFGSHYFNITGPTTNGDSSTSTAGGNKNATAGGNAQATPSTTSSDPSPTASSTPSANANTTKPQSPSNSSLAAGLGVAFGLVAALIAAFIFIHLRRRKRNAELARKHGWPEASPSTNTGDYGVAAGGYAKYEQLNEKLPVHGYGAGTPDGFGAQRSPSVHEMQGTAPLQRGTSTRRISGVHEMPVHTKGASNGIFSEEGC